MTFMYLRVFSFRALLQNKKNALRILNSYSIGFCDKKSMAGLAQSAKSAKKRGSFNALSCFTYSTLSPGGIAPKKIYFDAYLQKSNIIK